MRQQQGNQLPVQTTSTGGKPHIETKPVSTETKRVLFVGNNYSHGISRFIGIEKTFNNEGYAVIWSETMETIIEQMKTGPLAGVVVFCNGFDYCKPLDSLLEKNLIIIFLALRGLNFPPDQQDITCMVDGEWVKNDRAVFEVFQEKIVKEAKNG